MKAIYFIEKNDVKYYKCDTFWSKSTDYKNAKIHDDSIFDQNRFIESILYCLNDKDDDNQKYLIEFFQNTKYGYQVFEENGLSEPIYLKYITNCEKDSYDIIDYKQILRDEKINKIMDK